MKDRPSHIEAQCKSEVLTLAHLWLLKRTDGFILGLTDLDAPIKVGSRIYHPGGFTPTAIQSTSDFAVDNLDARGTLDPSGELITRQDLVHGVWDYAEITLSRVDFTMPNAGFEVLRRGWIGEVNTKNGEYRAEMRGLGQKLQQTIGILVLPSCRHTLGDRKCQVDMTAHTFEGTVTAVTGEDSFNDELRTEIIGDFDGGVLRWLSGLNEGISCEIKYSDADIFILQENMPKAIAVGDVYRIIRGCDKIRLGDCLNKFGNNTINFGGFDELPQRDALAALAGTR